MRKNRLAKNKDEQILLLQNMLQRVLKWPLPNGETVASYSLPTWLAEDSKKAIKGIVADEEYLEDIK